MTIFEILQDRDGLPKHEVDAIVKDLKEELLDMVTNGAFINEVQTKLMCRAGLEPDHLDEILFQSTRPPGQTYQNPMNPKIQPMFGISKVDSARQGRGYWVRLRDGNRSVNEYFGKDRYGDFPKALIAAERVRDIFVLSGSAQLQARAAKKKISKPRKLPTCISRLETKKNGKTYANYRATLQIGGRKLSQTFSIARYGEREALRLAKRALADFKSYANAQD